MMSIGHELMAITITCIPRSLSKRLAEVMEMVALLLFFHDVIIPNPCPPLLFSTIDRNSDGRFSFYLTKYIFML